MRLSTATTNRVFQLLAATGALSATQMRLFFLELCIFLYNNEDLLHSFSYTLKSLHLVQIYIRKQQYDMFSFNYWRRQGPRQYPSYAAILSRVAHFPFKFAIAEKCELVQHRSWMNSLLRLCKKNNRFGPVLRLGHFAILQKEITCNGLFQLWGCISKSITG